MTAPKGRLLPLNTAQARNLRNFTAEELPLWRLTILTEVTSRLTPDRARAVLVTIVARHEALRSRLAVGPSGCPMQEVLPARAAESVMRWHLVVENAFDSADKRFWEEAEIDPWLHAFHATAYVVDNAVAAVKVTVSHVFADRIGIQVIENELYAVFARRAPSAPDPRQASSYALTGTDPKVAQNTAFWREVLSEAPRSCTYAPVRRDEMETVHGVEIQLPDDLLRQVEKAASSLRTTPSCIWTAAVSILAEGLSGQHRQVFKTWTANRTTPQDFTAVVHLAQVVFMPLLGNPDDTLRARVDLATEVSFEMFERGTYDASAILDHFNTGSGFGGMFFHPAFEWHYIPTMHHVRCTPGAAPRIFEEQARPRLSSAMSDLQVSLSYEPGPILQVRARRPISEERSPESLLVDLIRTVELICRSPDVPTQRAGISALPSRADLVPGHHSGAEISLSFIKALVLAVPGIVECYVKIDDTDGQLLAELELAAGYDPTTVKAEIRSVLVQAHGTAVPDAYLFSFA
ncbi:condensation domain-containing protein [Actinoplanes sp. Pm04-4]|uniref:Condensation domain-containing protein n=1 Tax=Paractinoplanes pyxinae TaxID=2997416 RepID=A0ABT4BC43_9ACTN|nr:condensation domain-containing protein [Actinoplanes pyxinae]MCY1144089.1 condensation domain-containing protein [Actinoplanes pyxinae]